MKFREQLVVSYLVQLARCGVASEFEKFYPLVENYIKTGIEKSEKLSEFLAFKEIVEYKAKLLGMKM